MRLSRCSQVLQNYSVKIVAGFLALGIASTLALPTSAFAKSKPSHTATSTKADRLAGVTVSVKAQQMAAWILDSGDNGGLPFIIIDKPAAKAFVFSKDGQLLGAAWVLIGLARGDDSLPGIGTMPLSAITPKMRTTPAGRFVARLGQDLDPAEVLWVDYNNAISLHRVINTDPSERRLERIVSPNPSDHRISFGCINVPIPFFDKVVKPTFQEQKGVVYILPDANTLQAVFPNYYDVRDTAHPGAD
ncbi:MAG: hypothetical protein JO256_08520 [Alphaproteobacteria bacterium]|nr:hypothetical protein [Alphaproteobacteria bacterium]